MNMDLFGTVPVTLLLIIAVVGLVFSGLLAAMEIALSRLSQAGVEDLVEDGRKNAPALLTLLQRRRRTFYSLRSARTFFQVVAAVAITLVLVDPGLTWWLIALIAVVVVTIIQLLVVSVVPTRVASRNPEGVALAGTRITSALVSMSRIGNPVIHRLRRHMPQPVQTEAEQRQAMESDLREVVDQVGETRGFEDEDREMLRSVFELGHTLVREVMVPRTDMVTADFDLPADKALRLFIRSGYSRIPVEGEDVDDIRGILYFKDVVRRVQDEGPEARAALQAHQMMRRAEFTVEMQPADDLMRRMQQDQFHMALVVDEYGGISGLVTLEDILEELVGELTDEHDRPGDEPELVSDGVWRVPSRYALGDLEDLMDLEIDDDDVDSVGGLLTKAIGRVPLPGASGDLHGVHMVAEEARGRRRQVGTILCSYSAPEDTDEARAARVEAEAADELSPYQSGPAQKDD